MDEIHIVNELLDEERCKSMPSFFSSLQKYYAEKTIIPTQALTSDLINKELIDEINNISGDISVFFGKTLRDLKCTLKDEEGREHEIYLRYKSHRKLTITDVKLPHSTYQDREYLSIEEVTTEFQNYIKNLTAYFHELENIDEHCTVVEPTKPTFKDDYRRILLGGRTWLHIEVSPDGSPRNIHLIGHPSKQFDDKLNSGLLNWDNDKNIVENINCIFDLANILENQVMDSEQLDVQTDVPSCSICFCTDLEECQGLPQPLCHNPKCDVYYHKYCLFKWLVACEGGRPPAFGMAYGNCPTCLQPISCSEK